MGAGVGQDAAVVTGDPGTWTLVPEPSTAPLAGLGLLALSGYAARRGYDEAAHAPNGRYCQTVGLGSHPLLEQKLRER